MPAYDRYYDPPAPVAGVVLAHAITGASSGVLRGKLDTGAGLTRLQTRVWESPEAYAGYSGDLT